MTGWRILWIGYIWKKKIIFESAHPKQLSYWYLCKDQIKQSSENTIKANLREALHKLKEQKLDLEQKLKLTSKINFSIIY